MAKNKGRTRSDSNRTAENWSLPGEYREVFQEVERDLDRFRRSQQGQDAMAEGSHAENDTQDT